jgi:hypothetical protein
MTVRTAVASLAFVAVTTPLLADIPDGRGGRTSPQASPRAAEVSTPAHACCPRRIVSAPASPASPAERKAAGEVAWLSRNGTRTSERIPCFKMTGQPPVFASPAERKAVGHVTRATRPAAGRCCDAIACPMHRLG